MNSRLLVIGDIHGMFDELIILLKSAAYDPDIDRLVVLGDYIDRGNKSKEVLEFFMDLRARYSANVTLLKGNHEDLCLKAQQGDKIPNPTATLIWMANGGDKTLGSFGGSIPNEVLSFLKQLPYYYESEQHIFVHAGAHPTLPLSKANPQDLIWSSSSRPHYSGKMVIVGHAVRDEVSFDSATNTLYIDTGAFQGARGRVGKLSMVDLTNYVVHWVNSGGQNDGTCEVKKLAFYDKR